MPTRAHRIAKWASFGLAGLLIQDRFNGLDLGRLTPAVAAALLVALLAWLLTWEPIWSLIVPGPKIVGGEVSEFYRQANVDYPFTSTLSGLQYLSGLQGTVMGSQ